MTTTLFPASERGHAALGWLDSYHTFSFSHYFNPDRMRFGYLRVFNDDTVAPGAGFGTHPHDNMEIISIPLEGTIVHRDSMGNEQPLTPGMVQVMSAGTGITHSEFNGSSTDVLKFLQLWIIPSERGVAPRYAEADVPSSLGVHTMVGPINGSAPLGIHQSAWLHVVRLQAGASTSIALHDATHGSFAFVISGRATVNGVDVAPRDAVGTTDATTVEITTHEDLHAIVIETPMA
ncbi:MAG: pirin family protein [Candidatus Kapabacteria bacterium]|jgi:hypothetical protein|nr:pirin family protein [Candidatus Kapabacteria bacterium]